MDFPGSVASRVHRSEAGSEGALHTLSFVIFAASTGTASVMESTSLAGAEAAGGGGGGGMQGKLQVKDSVMTWKWHERIVRLNGATLSLTKPGSGPAPGGGTVLHAKMISGDRGNSKKPNRFDVHFKGPDNIGEASKPACFSAQSEADMTRWLQAISACGARVIPVEGDASGAAKSGSPHGAVAELTSGANLASSAKPLNGGWPAHPQCVHCAALSFPTGPTFQLPHAQPPSPAHSLTAMPPAPPHRLPTQVHVRAQLAT